MRGRRRGGSVPSMMQALQPLHGAPVVIGVVGVIGHAANQMGVSVGVLQRVQRGPGQPRGIGRGQGMRGYAHMVLSRGGALKGITSATVGLHDLYHISFQSHSNIILVVSESMFWRLRSHGLQHLIEMSGR